ncbi:MAG: DEAD/DEAH box helicase, partial [Oscillospiraceae bacterium]|nr:DEAD/DEAH box helicase [Oscillospiraceae bacterium]
MTPEQILSQYFGYDAFRPGQRELIGAVLSGRDALGIMPTGAGKSVCYQVPAMLLPGLTVVISPLISLMHDQVGALRQNGIPAAYLNSSLDEETYRETLSRVLSGEVR